MKQNLQRLTLCVLTLLILVPAAYLQADTVTTTTSPSYGNYSQAGVDPTAGVSSAGQCGAQISQLQQLQAIYSQAVDQYSTATVALSQVNKQIAQTIANGVGVLALKVTPSPIIPGTSFSVVFTASNSNTKSYTIDMLQNGSVVNTFVSNGTISTPVRPTNVSTSFIMPASFASSVATIRVRDTSNANINSQLNVVIQ